MKVARRSTIVCCAVAVSLICGLFLVCSLSAADGTDKTLAARQKADADKCDAKLKAMEDFVAKRKAGQKNSTRFQENEVNAYLAHYLSKRYHPSLKSLQIKFNENKLEAIASIDFDLLGTASSKILPKIMSFLFSGIHTLDARGQLKSSKGDGSFLLEQARFDDTVLPKTIVEGIITAVGKKQNPPFDPLQPSKMPYEIKEVAVHQGYIIVNQ